ncbi:PREDICTED: fibroblast growth factor receptor 2-like [Branchiostoma belcheri]|uniref:receptor protein-tyrosine kinase n=1 Tax=Branchiostoma belcheri TaxID=7741 RepID=A0A6P4Y8L8_BRABE|nr:PREDICTED: fibroblast growth factor receptor 2-like [Branchiostoma belcheri]
MVMVVQSCLPGYLYLSHTRRCYRAYDRSNSYGEALLICQAEGGTLAMPRDNIINDFLIDLKNGANIDDYFYIGLDRKDGSWNYVDGGDLRYTDWSVGQRLSDSPSGITLSLSSNPVCESQKEDVQLTCSVESGTTPVTYTFNRGTTQLAAGSSNSLTLSDVNRTQAGTYNCTVRNVPGEDYAQTSTAETLVVHYLDDPQVTPSSSVTAVEGNDLRVVCSARSIPDSPTLQWSKGGSNETAGATLRKNPVSRNDTGTYTYPPDMTVRATPNPVNETQSISLTCTADSNPNVTSITWMFVDTGETLLQQTTGNFLTYNSSSISHEHAGVYRCTADNGVTGSPVSKDITINVNFSPIFNHARDKYVIGRSRSVTLECSVLAYPQQVDFTWRKGEYDITGNTTSQSGVSTLYIASVQVEQYGNYTCTASNEYGQRTTVIQLVPKNIQVLYGTLAITSVEYTEGVCEGELANRIVTQLDSMFDSYEGYEGSVVTGCRPGSVLADFEATFAESEAAAVQTMYIESLSDGQLGEFTVDPESSIMSDIKPPAGGGDSTLMIIIIAAAAGGVVLIAGIIAVIFLVRRHTTSDNPAVNPPNSMELSHVSGESNDGYQSLRIPHRPQLPPVPEPEPTYEVVKIPSEFPRNQLAIKEEIGQGEFGKVHRAEAWNILDQRGTTVVAVKTMKAVTSHAALSAFFKELSILEVLGTHPNVVSYLGCCTDKDPFYLLLEYVSGGDLLSTLHTSRTNPTYRNLEGGSKPLSSRDLTKFAWDVAKGMSFLSSKNILHRDLATRNVLVSSDRICKVSDFGLSREGEEYETTSDARLPIRWMAPESLFHRKYTTKTDVWAFGVLLWEIATLGATPYPNMSMREVMDGVQQGYRMGKPLHCDEELYSLMSKCWNADPAQRPEFRNIQRTLDTLMETEHDYINLVNLDENIYTSLQTTKDEKY